MLDNLSKLSCTFAYETYIVFSLCSHNHKTLHTCFHYQIPQILKVLYQTEHSLIMNCKLLLHYSFLSVRRALYVRRNRPTGGSEEKNIESETWT
jgi:hypothetical protein